MVLYLVVHGADCAPTADRVSRKVQLMAKSRDNFAQKIGGLSVHKLSHGRQTQTSRVGPFTNFMFITQSFSVSGGWEVIAQDIFQDILAFIFTTPPIVSPTQGTPYALPYRRFVGVLTDANARLGADVDRYTFIVVDLHHLLLAGLPAHFESYMPSHAVGLSQVRSPAASAPHRAKFHSSD